MKTHFCDANSQCYPINSSCIFYIDWEKLSNFVRTLYSAGKKKYYVGQTQDLEHRLYRHNRGLEHYTRSGVPWNLIWSKECRDRSEAMKLERKIKKRGAGRYLAHEDPI